MGSYGTMDLVTEQGLEDPLIKTIGAVGYYQVSKLTLELFRSSSWMCFLEEKESSRQWFRSITWGS